MSDTFPIIILVGRPAAGKSEIIDFLKPLCENIRRGRFHIAPFEEIDDFVWVWETFQDDDIRSQYAKPRLHTTPDYFFLDPFIWNFFIEKINLAFAQRVARDSNYLRDHTAIIEFARGGENAFGEAFSYLSDEILKRAVIVYIRVSYEESVRKNRKRKHLGEEGSILHHSLPDNKMEFYYRTNDWEKLSNGASDGTIEVKGHRVPFAVFENEPEKTDDPIKLGQELERVTNCLWKIWKLSPTSAPIQKLNGVSVR